MKWTVVIDRGPTAAAIGVSRVVEHHELEVEGGFNLAFVKALLKANEYGEAPNAIIALVRNDCDTMTIHV